MVRIALVQPKADTRAISPPLNLAILAGYIRNRLDVEVKIIDGNAEQNVYTELHNFSPDIVGVTVTTPLAYSAYEIAHYTNSELNAFTIIGGIHATSAPEEASEHFDTVVKGEGESAMLNIVKDIEAGRRPAKIIEGTPQPNLDSLPIPAYDLLDMDYYAKKATLYTDYFYRCMPKKPVMGYMITSRGCPYRCIFCCNSFLNTPLRFNSAERVVEEINLLIDEYGINMLYFHDDDFAINKKRLKKLHNLFKEQDIPDKLAFTCQVRATTDIESLKLLKEMNCKSIGVGFESGNQRVLSILKANSVTLEDSYRIVKDTNSIGLNIVGTFIIGMPTETKEEMLDTMDFIKKSNLHWVGFNVPTPYPKTTLWKIAVENGLLPRNMNYNNLKGSPDTDTYILCDTMTKDEFLKLFKLIAEEATVPMLIRRRRFFSRVVIKSILRRCVRLGRQPFKLISNVYQASRAKKTDS